MLAEETPGVCTKKEGKVCVCMYEQDWSRPLGVPEAQGVELGESIIQSKYVQIRFDSFRVSSSGMASFACMQVNIVYKGISFVVCRRTEPFRKQLFVGMYVWTGWDDDGCI